MSKSQVAFVGFYRGHHMLFVRVLLAIVDQCIGRRSRELWAVRMPLVGHPCGRLGLMMQDLGRSSGQQAGERAGCWAGGCGPELLSVRMPLEGHP